MTPKKEEEIRPASLGYAYIFRCNECETPVNVNCMTRPLTEKEQAEMAARMLCTPCLNKAVGKK